ncbi:MAG: DoxX family protein [Propionibacteriaceae bacterium]
MIRTEAAPTTSTTERPSQRQRRVGLVLTALVGLFLAFDVVVHLLRIDAVVDSFAKLGFPLSVAIPIGLLELVCLVLYLVPRTSVLGAILLTGYLGGAMSAQVRIDAPLVSTLLFPVYVGIVVWAGLYLRQPRLRALVPLRRDHDAA